MTDEQMRMACDNIEVALLRIPLHSEDHNGEAIQAIQVIIDYQQELLRAIVERIAA